MPRVHLFVPCYVDQFAPEVARATVAVLERAGCEVVIKTGQTCCGQPAFNAGYHDEARTAARNWLRAFDGAEVIVTPSGSCAAMVRSFYPGLLQGGAPATGQAKSAIETAGEASARTFELAEYLVDQLGIDDLGASWDGDVTWHDGCHGLRELGIEAAPRRLLTRVKGLRLVEMDERRSCCGFGGMFSVKYPKVSTAMADVKRESALRTGAPTVVTGDVSCLLHLRGRSGHERDGLRYLHLAEILDCR